MDFSESNNVRNRSSLHVNLYEQQEVECITDVCRICANIADPPFPVFDEGHCEDLAAKMNKYLPIKVSEEDGLPQVICEQCQSTLLAWDELVKCCIQANVVLQQKLTATDLLEPGITKPEERIQCKESTHNGQTLICVKVENDKNTAPDRPRGPEERTADKPRDVTKGEKSYSVCGTCNKSIAVASWRRHSLSHSAVKRHSCHVCGLGFNDSGNLARHRRAVHAGHRPHACTICHKNFSRNGHLKEHIKTHYENRDYICDTCGKASKSSAALRMHKRTHKKEYRFPCVYCEAQFKRRSELVVHRSVHTGEKAHCCACGKAFRLRAQLKSHMQTHIKEIKTIAPV